jgi:alpha,alpha-trehalase
MDFRTIAKYWFISLLFVVFSCNNSGEDEARSLSAENYYKTEFFKQVQLSGIFDDSKTFVDCVPKRPINEIIEAYEANNASEFDLKSFVLDNFELPYTRSSDFVSDTTESISEHIKGLWPVLTQDPDQYNPYSSLIPLPNPYIVPGGRFREIYYWDSYFTLLGLMISDQEELAKNMVDNFSFLIDSIGFIPNGNRAYYAGRSQPPFFSLMVHLIAADDKDEFISYQPSLIKEYDFWMTGSQFLGSENIDEARVVLMPDSSILNRYWDHYDFPRPESFKPDFELVEEYNLAPATTYRHLRAGAESGWDYCSRWFKDHKNISTIHTTDIIPIDLNSLLYNLEIMIAQSYDLQGQVEKSKEFNTKAKNRKKAINKYLWDDESNFFIDYDYLEGKPTGVLSLAGIYPLFFKMASEAQAKVVQERIEEQFLMPGGFISTLRDTGEQWDAPNGWAPLQWLTINGLYNYGYDELGNAGAQKWLNRNKEVFKATGKMMEKYNVLDTEMLAGGGEYALQDGFGWTNGVALALEKIILEKQKAEVLSVQD